MPEYDHPFDIEEMGRDPPVTEIEDLSDHDLAELYRDVAGGAGSVDLYDKVAREMVQRFDEYEAEDRLGGRTLYAVVNNDGYASEPITLMCDEGADYGPSVDRMAIYESRHEAEVTASVVADKRGADVSVIRMEISVVETISRD